MSGKATVGDIGEDLILIGGVGLLAYFVLKNFLPNLGQGVSQNNTQTAATTTDAYNADLAAAQSAGGQQSLSATAIAAMASQIDNDLQSTSFWTGSPTPDLADAVAQVDKINNSVDWYALIKAFGVRNYNTGGSQSLCSWFAIECTQVGLVAALQAAIKWSEQDDATGITAQNAVNTLNTIMQNIGATESFNM